MNSSMWQLPVAATARKTGVQKITREYVQAAERADLVSKMMSERLGRNVFLKMERSADVRYNRATFNLIVLVDEEVRHQWAAIVIEELKMIVDALHLSEELSKN